VVGLASSDLHHLAGVGIVHQGKKKMLERGVFMMPFAGELDGMMQCLFQTPR
jgi:hypothetical protein